MRSLQWMAAGLALLLGAAYACAQVVGGGSTISGTLTASATVNLSASGVKGVPFSADVIEESDQALVDGNHIRREMHGRIFRDSEGRSRQETEFPTLMAGGEKRMRVMIMDPVQQLAITLDPQNKIATIRHLGQHRLPVTVEANKRAAVPSPQTYVRKASHMKQEDLGTMEIEGFVAAGKRFTHTIEAGSIGNDKPLISVNETWFSDDLKTLLLTKSEKPEFGQHIRKLVNIHTGNPDPLLFQPPPDYTVKDVTQQ